MTKEEKKEVYNQTLNIYSGILANNMEFASGNNEEIKYEFNLKQFKELKEKYQLEKIAGSGSDFTRSLKLLKYLAPRLTHSSWYDNSIKCNALRLLEYSLNNPNHGINCLNKSKILEECCLAIGIYARRVGIMPYSPFDFDNHVVTEIYDRNLKKWIMLDPTTNGYFIDEKMNPLSLLEMRNKFANDEKITFITSKDKLLIENFEKYYDKYIEVNSYICKNLFYFTIDQDSTFGVTNRTLQFAPKGFSIKNKTLKNLKYRCDHLPEGLEEWQEMYFSQIRDLEKRDEYTLTDIRSMEKSPI